MQDAFIATHPNPHRVLIADAWLAGVMLVLVALPQLVFGEGLTDPWLGIGAAAFLIRRTHPRLFAVIVTANAGASFATLGMMDVISDLYVLAGVYSVAAFAPRAWRHSGFGVLAAALGVIAIAGMMGDPFLAGDGEATTGMISPENRLAVTGAMTVATTVAVITAWALGIIRRQQLEAIVRERERADLIQRDAERRASLAVTDERARISREMHDIIAHSIASMVTLAEGGRMAAARNPEGSAELFALISQSGREALGDVKRLLRTVDDEQDDAPARGLEQIGELVERSRLGGAPVEFRTSGDPRPVAPAMGQAIYRVAQESLTNILKHSSGGAASLQLRWGDEELTMIARNAVDPGPAALASVDGRGLAGMRDRVALFDGTFHAGREAESFTLVTVWPLPDAAP